MFGYSGNESVGPLISKGEIPSTASSNWRRHAIYQAMMEGLPRPDNDHRYYQEENQPDRRKNVEELIREGKVPKMFTYNFLRLLRFTAMIHGLPPQHDAQQHLIISTAQ